MRSPISPSFQQPVRRFIVGAALLAAAAAAVLPLREARACGCYHAARREYTRLFPVNEIEGIATTPVRPMLAPVRATGWRKLAELGQAANA